MRNAHNHARYMVAKSTRRRQGHPRDWSTPCTCDCSDALGYQISFMWSTVLLGALFLGSEVSTIFIERSLATNVTHMETPAMWRTLQMFVVLSTAMVASTCPCVKKTNWREAFRRRHQAQGAEEDEWGGGTPRHPWQTPLIGGYGWDEPGTELSSLSSVSSRYTASGSVRVEFVDPSLQHLNLRVLNTPRGSTDVGVRETGNGTTVFAPRERKEALIQRMVEERMDSARSFDGRTPPPSVPPLDLGGIVGTPAPGRRADPPETASEFERVHFPHRHILRDRERAQDRLEEGRVEEEEEGEGEEDTGEDGGTCCHVDGILLVWFIVFMAMLRALVPTMTSLTVMYNSHKDYLMILCFFPLAVGFFAWWRTQRVRWRKSLIIGGMVGAACMTLVQANGHLMDGEIRSEFGVIGVTAGLFLLLARALEFVMVFIVLRKYRPWVRTMGLLFITTFVGLLGSAALTMYWEHPQLQRLWNRGLWAQIFDGSHMSQQILWFGILGSGMFSFASRWSMYHLVDKVGDFNASLLTLIIVPLTKIALWRYPEQLGFMVHSVPLECLDAATSAQCEGSPMPSGKSIHYVPFDATMNPWNWFCLFLLLALMFLFCLHGACFRVSDDRNHVYRMDDTLDWVLVPRRQLEQLRKAKYSDREDDEGAYDDTSDDATTSSSYPDHQFGAARMRRGSSMGRNPGFYATRDDDDGVSLTNEEEFTNEEDGDYTRDSDPSTTRIHMSMLSDDTTEGDMEAENGEGPDNAEESELEREPERVEFLQDKDDDSEETERETSDSAK